MTAQAASMRVDIDYEATLDRTILRRCAPCFERGVITPHPLATGHPDGACPACGAPTATEILPTIVAVVDPDAASQIFGA
jgi:hypothetical protein